MSKGLDSEQDRLCIDPDLGPNGLQGVSADTSKVAASKVRVNWIAIKYEL